MGATACWYIHPLIGWAFLGLTLVFVYLILRKHCCKTCYYCKKCTLGFGKLPELFFHKEGTANVDDNGLTMFPFLYVAMTFIPVIAIIISISNQFTSFKISVLILLIAFSMLSGINRRKLFTRGFKT